MRVNANVQIFSKLYCLNFSLNCRLNENLGKVHDLIDLYFELNGTNMLLKKQIIHIIYNELTASGKLGSSNVNNMFCALEY